MNFEKAIKKAIEYEKEVQALYEQTAEKSEGTPKSVPPGT